MKNAANCGSVLRAASIAGFVIEVIRHSSMAWLVEVRKFAPSRHPSPKNCPSAKIPTTASLPCSDNTVILTLPFWMKKSVSAMSPWLKIFWFLQYRSMVLPASARPRKALGSKIPSEAEAWIDAVLGMVSVRHQAGSATLSVTGTSPQGDTVMNQYSPTMSGRRLKSGRRAKTFRLIPQGDGSRWGTLRPLSHLTSAALVHPRATPRMSEAMGSLDTTVV